MGTGISQGVRHSLVSAYPSPERVRGGEILNLQNRGSIMAEDNLLLDLTPEEVSVMRQALRHHAEYYKRSDFKVLEARALELLSKVNDAIIDSKKQLV
jgi:hypothetical protein